MGVGRKCPRAGVGGAEGGRRGADPAVTGKATEASITMSSPPPPKGLVFSPFLEGQERALAGAEVG